MAGRSLYLRVVDLPSRVPFLFVNYKVVVVVEMFAQVETLLSVCIGCLFLGHTLGQTLAAQVGLLSVRMPPFRTATPLYSCTSCITNQKDMNKGYSRIFG